MNSARAGIKPDLFLLLTRVRQLLIEQDIECYIVGGLVRDLFLGRETADIDIAVAADALDVAQNVASALGGKYVLLDTVNKIARVVLEKEVAGHWEIDFSTFEGNIEQDLKRRDFTIDAMAIELKRLDDPINFKLIDPLDGLADLRQKLIRAVSDTVFSADAARLLRAVRLAAELNFTIDNNTEALIRRGSQLIKGVAGERNREELLRLLASPHAGRFTFYLDELGLLTSLIPELAVMKGVEQLREHHWDVFNHSLKTVEACDFLLRQNGWEYADKEVLAEVPWMAVIVEYFDREVSYGSTRGLLLKMAALLHDIAKPQTKTIETDGRTRFIGHAKEGAAIAADILQRLRFSTKEIELVQTIVGNHLRPTQMAQEGLPTHRAIYRYFRDTGEAGIGTLFISLADHLATRGPNLDSSNWREHTRLVEYVLAKYLEEESIARPSKLIDGYDIIKLFSLKPGPQVGEILEAVREAQASGEITNRQKALDFVKKLVEKGPADK
ncbi:MAG: HD domain-containing protein [Chloroflexota bacterium]